MIQVAVISENTLADFESAFNETCANLSRFDIKEVKEISDTCAKVYYDTGEEQELVPAQAEVRAEPDYIIELDDECEKSVFIELRFKTSGRRYCCECENYNWGKNCPYREGHIRFMDEACPMFNIMIQGGA